jgi:polyisoprenyl-phosphate glycosyltransferase
MLTALIVVPCFNEEAILRTTNAELVDELNRLIDKGTLTPASRFVYIDDGRRDDTWGLIEQFTQADGHLQTIKLSRNADTSSTAFAPIDPQRVQTPFR